MVRDLRSSRDPLWETVLAIDDFNEGVFRLQTRLKNGGCPVEALRTWQYLRDSLERKLLALCGQQRLPSPSERACSSLRTGMETMLTCWDLSPWQRQRVELWLSKAERERLGAEAAAA